MGPNKTPLEDLRRADLELYEEGSMAIHHYSSSIPKAINFYWDARIEKELAESETVKSKTQIDSLLERAALNINSISSFGSIKPSFIEMICKSYMEVKIKELGLRPVIGEKERLDAEGQLLIWAKDNSTIYNKQALYKILKKLEI